MRVLKEKKPVYTIKISTQKPRKLDFFKGVSPWFMSKNGDFLIFSFLCKMDKERVFLESSESKKSRFRPKNIGSKNRQN